MLFRMVKSPKPYFERKRPFAKAASVEWRRVRRYRMDLRYATVSLNFPSLLPGVVLPKTAIYYLRSR